MAERKKGPPRSRVQSGPLAQRTGKQRTPARPRGGDSGAVSVEKRPLSKLAYKEVKGDLFDCPPDCSLAHCVSEDMAMGKGIATLFKEKFGGVSQLKAQGTRSGRGCMHSSCAHFVNTGVKTGGLALLEREGRFVYYLVSHKYTSASTKPFAQYHLPKALQVAMASLVWLAQIHYLPGLCKPDYWRKNLDH